MVCDNTAYRASSERVLIAAIGIPTPLSTSPNISHGRPKSGDWSALAQRPHSDGVLPRSARTSDAGFGESSNDEEGSPRISARSSSPPPLAPKEAMERAIALSRELSAANIPSEVTETGDLMLDMTGFKNNEEDAFRAEILARKILSEELEGNYDIGSLFGMDERGNLWIYSSQDAKEAAMKKAMDNANHHSSMIPADAASDPGYHSDGSDVTTTTRHPSHRRSESDVGAIGMQTPPSTPPSSATAGDPNLNYAKTLRLTSDQLLALNLTPGENAMSFTVNRATCQAYMYLWKHDNPVVISDIDGTITKSDALGHVLNMIGRDWTHSGVAKLYSDIVANGYNIMYLTSRSVGQADTTRTYLAGIYQDNYRLPRGPTILSPDRTMAALRREIYLRQPHVFKMSTLRDIRNLYGPDRTPFYAGFGNRFTDQISYRTVDVPRTRIFTINSNAEVSLDLLSLNGLKMTYVNINEVVDHYFPPVGTLVKGGGEEYTDFKYWRDTPRGLDDFLSSDSEDGGHDENESVYAEEDEEEVGEEMGDSYISRDSVDVDGDGADSIVSGSVEGEDHMMSSMIQDDEADADNEDDDGEEDNADQEDNTQVIEPAAASKLSESRIVVADYDAQIITGVKQLALERKVSK
jgi:phosphatidate phosphatase LPIN